MYLLKHLRLMAQYNHVMNQKFYAVAASLPDVTLYADKGAFFGSIFRTLTHIAVGDIIWLKRFASALPECVALDPVRNLSLPASLDAVLEPTFAQLMARRAFLDEVINSFAATIDQQQLLALVHFHTLKGVEFNKELFSLLMHMFNHQTHHRGQVTTLFSQAGVDVGVTDLAVFIPNIDAE